jgi:hypothetical protein
MVLFCTPDEKIIFIINLKCGYSTFMNLKSMNIVKDICYLPFIFKKAKVFMIVRDPVERFISFYKNKFLQKHRFGEESQLNMINHYSKSFILSNQFTIKK